MTYLKKVVNALFLAALILLPLKALAGVEGQQVDQSNETNSLVGCATLYNYNRYQTFKPMLNRVLSVDAKLSDRKIGTNATLTIKKVSDDSVLKTETHSLTVAGDGIETFSFDDPFVTVTPEESYSMTISTNDTQTKWCYSDDTYARGQASIGSNRDFVFIEMGKLVETSSDSTPTSTPADQSSSTQATTTTTTTTTESDFSVSLTYILLNDEKISPPISNLEVINGDTFVVYGKSDKNINVKISYGDIDTTTKSDATGVWSITIPTEDLAHLDYTFSAKADNSASLNLDPTELFAFKVVAESNVISSVSAVADNASTTAKKIYNSPTAIAILVLVIVGIGTGGYFIWRKRKKMAIAREVTKKIE
jgi:hypothetical protein